MAERIVFFKTSRASFATTRNSSNLGGHPKVPVRTTSGERCGLNTGEAISVRASTHAPRDVLLQAEERDRVNRNFFAHEFGRDEYDCAVVGFFLSHLTEAQEGLLFAAPKRMLDPSSGRFLILDSAWSAERARFNAKSERQKRRLNDDGTPFEIYKRYIDRQDISGWERKYDVTISIEYVGTAFFAVSGRFTHGV